MSEPPASLSGAACMLMFAWVRPQVTAAEEEAEDSSLGAKEGALEVER